MAPRRTTARGGSQNSRGNTRRQQAGIRKNTRSRQPPSRYGQNPEQTSTPTSSQIAHNEGSDSDEAASSSPQHSYSPSSSTNTLQPSRTPISRSSTVQQPRTPSIPRQTNSSPVSHAASETSINLNTMRELLRSHEQDIVDRVLHQLTSQNPPQHSIVNTEQHSGSHQRTRTQPPPPNPTMAKIAELESQLAQLRAQNELEQSLIEQNPPGMLNSTQIPITDQCESASEIIDSVETMFPGVERATLLQIIENRFKPTNIYRLLASEKERAETHRTISIGGVEFEQAEREGKESEYRMSIFFKAWAAYSGILIKLAPHRLQGDLATALCIYTMNLYDLLEKYTWDGVKSYHFQFHRKRVASGKKIYEPRDWRQLDSELVASKCFAHPAPRGTWSTSQKPVYSQPRRVYELPIRESAPGSTYSYPGAAASTFFPSTESRIVPNQSAFTQARAPLSGSSFPPGPAPPCRNWNFRECRLPQCRYQHTCLSCGNSHKVSQCTMGTGAQAQPSWNGNYGR